MIANPCRRNCCLDLADICIGCGRSYQEIIAWHQSSDIQKQQILDLANERLKARSSAFASAVGSMISINPKGEHPKS